MDMMILYASVVKDESFSRRFVCSDDKATFGRFEQVTEQSLNAGQGLGVRAAASRRWFTVVLIITANQTEIPKVVSVFSTTTQGQKNGNQAMEVVLRQTVLE